MDVIPQLPMAIIATKTSHRPRRCNVILAYLLRACPCPLHDLAYKKINVEALFSSSRMDWTKCIVAFEELKGMTAVLLDSTKASEEAPSRQKKEGKGMVAVVEGQ